MAKGPHASVHSDLHTYLETILQHEAVRSEEALPTCDRRSAEGAALRSLQTRQRSSENGHVT